MLLFAYIYISLVTELRLKTHTVLLNNMNKIIKFI